jgi:hypothetical protein
MAFFDSSLLRNSFLALHGCTAGKPMKSYAEKFGKFSKQKATKAAKTPFGDPPEKSIFVFFVVFCKCNRGLRGCRTGSGQAEISEQKITKETKILFCPS